MKTPKAGLLLSGTALLCILALAAGCARYGGPEGLVRRVQAEVAGLRPHPQFVPTPLAAAPAASAAGLVGGEIALPAPSNPVELPAEPTDRPPAGLDQATPLPIEVEPAFTPTPTPAPPTPVPTPAHQPPLPAVALEGVTHMWQTWNNCGPATLAMNLSYFGSTLGQAEIGAVLRLHPDDKNVSPQELAAYARTQGYHARVLVDGDADQVRLLLSNGVPVLIETWLVPEPNDGMGHYRLLTGYDDDAQHWIAYDTYYRTGLVNPDGPYAGIRLPYAETDELWKVFNRTYVLAYPDQRAAAVESILGSLLHEPAMWQQALIRAQAEVENHPDDPFAWFNLGSDLVALGRYAEAAGAYDQARLLGLPWRMLWYQFGPFQAYLESGRTQEVIALADATLQTVNVIEEVHYWRGRALAAQGDVNGARQALERAIALNGTYVEAAEALAALNLP